MARDGSLYDVLGVKRSASVDEIKSAFRKHARDLHPDTAHGRDTEERFKEVSRAYAILGNAEQRQKYDRGDIDATGAATYGAGNKGRKPGWSAHRADARKNSGKKASGENIKVAGANVSYSLRVGGIDATNGTRQRITTTSGKDLDVRIPPGVKNGQVLRLKGQGMPGIGGGQDGDALVEIIVDSRDTFRIEGNDVHLDLPISLKEALHGASVEAPGLDGVLRLTIPAGSNSGDALRLKGKGMPSSSGTRGDQIVHLIVTLPSKPDSALNAFVRDWSPQAPFTGRDRLRSKQKT